MNNPFILVRNCVDNRTNSVCHVRRTGFIRLGTRWYVKNAAYENTEGDSGSMDNRQTTLNPNGFRLMSCIIESAAESDVTTSC